MRVEWKESEHEDDPERAGKKELKKPSTQENQTGEGEGSWFMTETPGTTSISPHLTLLNGKEDEIKLKLKFQS